MPLRTHCIYTPVNRLGGTPRLLVSIMSRHTEDDGITPDSRITKVSFDLHLPVLGPPDTLAGDYCKRKCISWEEYERRFNGYLAASSKAEVTLWVLCTLAKSCDIVLLCKEATPHHCHRRLVAEYCRKLYPSLTIIIE